MYINTNLGAMQAYTNVVQTNQTLTQYQGELSSGLAVNNPYQNPADYAISQQMQNQVLGLNQSSQNIQAGVSLIQTATGTMTQIESILQSMGTLANQAANTGLQQSNRASIQSQLDQYSKEITSLANTTQYNGKAILTGQFGNLNANTSNNFIQVQTGANQSNFEQFNINATDAYSLGVTRAVASSVTYASQPFGSGVTFSLDQTNNGSIFFQPGAGGIASFTVQVYGSSGSGSLTTYAVLLSGSGASAVTVGSAVTLTGTTPSTYIIGSANKGEALSVTSLTQGTAAGISTVTIDFNTSSAASISSQGSVYSFASTSGGPLVSSVTYAQQAITSIQSAINNVNAALGYLGSIQNRLNFTNNGVQNESQNLTQAQGVMIDANIPQVESQFQQQQILLQSGIAMAAQANMQPSYLLKLIQ